MMNQIYLLSIVCVTSLFSQDIPNSYYYKFYFQNAKIDSTLNYNIRNEFEDDDGTLPLKSIFVDLNNDKIPEKLIPNEFLFGNAGGPWLVYSQKDKVIIGHIVGGIIYINKDSINSYNVIETYWRNGAGKGIVYFYQFSNNKYKLVKKNHIQNNQIDVYFNSKKALEK